MSGFLRCTAGGLETTEKRKGPGQTVEQFLQKGGGWGSVCVPLVDHLELSPPS